MNDERSFERYVADNVGSLAGGSPLPNDFYDDLRDHTESHKQPPRWLALIKEPPMRLNSQPAVGSWTVRFAAGVIATLLMVAALAVAGATVQRLVAADATIIVAQDGGGDHATIGEALVAAVDGDTILIRPGTYEEATTIDKAVSLQGDGPIDEIVITVEDGPIMVIDDDATLSGLTLMGPDSDGVNVGGGTVLLEDLVFDHVGQPFTSAPCAFPCWSVDISGGSHVTVRDSQLIGGGEILVSGGPTVEIVGNTLSGGPHIALFELGPGSEVRNNTISDNASRGIGLYRPTDATISGNTIFDTPEYGITVGWDDGLGVEPNIVANTISGAAYGIDVASRAMPIIERNALFDNGTGITVRDSDVPLIANDLGANGTGITIHGGAPELHQNAVSDNAIGIAISSVASPLFTENTICGNDVNIQLVSDAPMPDMGGDEVCEDAPPA